MISGLVLKCLSGECFVIRRGYETTLPVSTSFCLTVPAWDVFVARVHGGSERAALENYCEVSGYNQVKLHTIVKKWGQS